MWSGPLEADFRGFGHERRMSTRLSSLLRTMSLRKTGGGSKSIKWIGGVATSRGARDREEMALRTHGVKTTSMLSRLGTKNQQSTEGVLASNVCHGTHVPRQIENGSSPPVWTGDTTGTE